MYTKVEKFWLGVLGTLMALLMVTALLFLIPHMIMGISGAWAQLACERAGGQWTYLYDRCISLEAYAKMFDI